MQKQNVSAFTTIEILVVISVIAVLTVGVLTAVQRARVQSRNSELKKVMSEMEGVQTTIKSERNTFAGYQPGVGFEDQRLQEIHQEIKDINGVGIASARLLKGKSDGWVIFTPTLGITGGKSGSLCYSSESKAPRRYNTYNPSDRYALAVQENDWKCPVNRLSDLPGIGDEGLTYDWFDISGYVADKGGHPDADPDDEEEMDKLFDVNTDGVKFMGNGHHNKPVAWHKEVSPYGVVTSWTYGKPSYISNSDDFSWQARGTLKVPTTGDYTFGIDGDDAIDLKIDGNRIVSWYGPHCAVGKGEDSPNYNAPAESCANDKPGPPDGKRTITLTEGYHDINVRVVDGGGVSAAAVGWERPGDGDGDFQIDTIPKSFLYRYQISTP